MSEISEDDKARLSLWDATSECTSTRTERARLAVLRQGRSIARDNDYLVNERTIDILISAQTELRTRLEAGRWRATAIWNAGRAREDVLPGWWVGADFNIYADTAEGHGSTLTGVRVITEISLSRSDDSAPGAASAEKMPALHDSPIPRPVWTESAGRPWFSLRVGTWPKDAPFPTESEDLAAATDYFAARPPRGKFREVRRDKTPESWRKPGPRRGR